MLWFTLAATRQGMGGAENLIINLASQASNIHPMGVICHQDSYTFKRLRIESPHVTLVDCRDSERLELNRDDVLVIDSSSSILGISNNPRVYIWNILVSNVLGWNKLPILTNKAFKHKTRGLVERAHDSKSLAFMDGATRDSVCNRLKLRLQDPVLIPVPIRHHANKYLNKSRRLPELKRELHVTYIGRGRDLWKIHPLEHFCYCLATTPRIKKPRITIITDFIELYREILKPYELTFKIDYKIGMSGDNLTAFLATRSDLHLGMGTSALEGAAVGIPTILVDPSFRRLPRCYKFRWLFQTREYSLGRFIDDTNKDWSGMYVEELIDAILNPRTRRLISEKTHDYTIKNHSIPSVWQKIVNVKPSMFLEELKQYTIRSFATTQNVLRYYDAVKRVVHADEIKTRFRNRLL